MEGAFRTGWQSDYPSMFNFLSALYTTASAEGRGSNDGDYMNPEFDEALGEALSATEDEESFSLGQQAQEILFEDLPRSEEHTSELQSRGHLVCRLLLEKKK